MMQSFPSTPLSQGIPSSPRAQSPNSKGGSGGSRRTDYKTDSETFSQQILVGKSLVRALIRLSFHLGQLSKSGAGPEKTSIPVPGSIETLNKMATISLGSSLSKNLDKWGKQFRASVPKRRGKTSDKPNPTNALFYISDQLRGFLSESNFGNGLAFLLTDARYNQLYPDINTKIQWAGANRDYLNDFTRLFGGPAQLQQAFQGTGFDSITAAHFDVKTALQSLVFGKGMITARILLTLLSLIRYSDNLMSRTNGQRIHTNPTMLRWFGAGGSTAYTFNGRDLAAELVQEQQALQAQGRGNESRMGKLNSDTQGKLSTNLGVINGRRTDSYSAFERIATREAIVTNKKSNVAFPTYIEQKDARNGDDWGYLQIMNFALASLFHIPDGLMTPQEVAALKSQRVEEKTQTVGVDGKVNEEKKLGPELNQNVNDALGLGDYVNRLLSVHRELHEPEKKERQRLKRAQKGPVSPLPVAGQQQQQQQIGGQAVNVPQGFGVPQGQQPTQFNQQLGGLPQLVQQPGAAQAPAFVQQPGVAQPPPFMQQQSVIGPFPGQ